MSAAQKALDLIEGAHQLIQGSGCFFDNDMRPFPANSAEARLDEERHGPRIITELSARCFPLSCEVAAKASRKRSHVYALALYMQSQRLHCNHVMDLEPCRWPYEHRSPLPRDHARFAYAIVTAYAVLEQLGLEVRASNQRPSMINGQWNPVVRADLEERLRRQNVDLTNTAIWCVRGARSRIEADRPPRRVRRAPWAYRQVRDVEVELVDAINDLSWLRSRVSAHRLRDVVEILSVHDVSNAQYLAGRVLLSSLGYWRHETGGYVAPIPKQARRPGVVRSRIGK